MNVIFFVSRLWADLPARTPPAVNHHVPREMWNLFGKKKTPAEMLRCARDPDPARPASPVESSQLARFFFRADDVRR
jgi:hypothetical protein